MKKTLNLLQESRFGVSPSRDFLYLADCHLNNLSIVELRGMEEMITVDVRVGRYLRDFVVSSSGGGDVFVPGKDSVIWGLLKQHLITSAVGWQPVPDELRREYIRIALRPTRCSAKSYSVPADRVQSVNTLFRCYLSRTGERVVARFLNKEFKKTFHDYMRGCLRNTDTVSIKDAIENFMIDHNISDGDGGITHEMLRKDWYRYSTTEQRENLVSINI